MSETAKRAELAHMRVFKENECSIACIQLQRCSIWTTITVQRRPKLQQPELKKTQKEVEIITKVKHS